MFSWSNSNNRGDNGHSRPQHISSYLNDPTLKPSTKKASKDDSTYETVFQTIDAHTLILRVHVPPQPSREKCCPLPVMALVGMEGHHPWLDNTMKVVGYGPISSQSEFQKSRLLLSQIVNAVVREFQLKPPKNIRITAEELQKQQPSEHRTNHQSNYQGLHSEKSPPPYSSSPRDRDVSEIHFSEVINLTMKDSQQISDAMRNYTMPSVPCTISEISTMNEDEVSELINDTDKLIPILEQHMFVTKIEEEKSTLRSSNSVTVTTNLIQKEYLCDLYNEVIELQKLLKKKVEKFNALRERQIELCKPVNNDLVLKKLNKAKKQSMKESDDLAHEWLENNTVNDGAAEVDRFIDKFLEKRIVHHVRAAKIERIET